MRWTTLNNSPLQRCCAWYLAMVVVMPLPAIGQLRIRTTGGADESRPPATLERNLPAENLLRKAEDAIDREDWKLAIDSLQRVLDEPVSGLLRTESDNSASEGFANYEQPGDRARAMLEALPDDGVAAYRLLHDGRAETLLKQALDGGDALSLAAVVARFPISSVADNAAEILAGIRMDHGDAAGALELLDFIGARHSDPDVSPGRVAQKRAVCLLMVGDREGAREALGSVPQPESEEGAAVRALVEKGWQTSEETGRVVSESWPCVGGDPSRRGRMAAVAPELRANLPWRFALPSNYPDWWENYWEDDEGEAHRDFPVGQAVAANGRVFVPTLSGVVALDLESLEPLWVWETAGKAVAPHVVRRRGFFPRTMLARARFSDRQRMLYDHVGALVSVDGDLVFTVQREGGEESPSFHRSSRGAIVPMAAAGSMLVAHDAASGAPRWTRGRTITSEDPLGGVEFLSAPLSVGNELWCVFARETDLFIGALDRADGRLIRELALCSVETVQLDDILHEAIYPALDGNRFYISASIGLVVAVDVHTFTLAWATSYPRLPANTGAIAPLSWMAGPPHCTGAVLIAAPPDSDMLMALDRHSGSVRWARARPADANYVLATDDNHVWLGGERFFQVAIRDGVETWATSHRDRVEAAGRAALSGSNIFAPTRDGLLVFDSSTGDRVDHKPLPEDQLPLGNLLCIAGALISTDTNEVRKFPDLTLSYPHALARHERDPTDRRAAVRLAWMELLRGAPDRALTALDGVRISSSGDRLTGADVSKLRVDALVGMSRAEGCTLEASIEYLERALRIATANPDRLRAGLALAARLRDAGRIEQGYLNLLELGLSSAGDGFLTVEPRLRNKARRVIGEVLSRFERELTAAQLATIARQSNEALEAARSEMMEYRTRGRGIHRLRQLAELNDAGGSGQHALLLLARAELNEKQFERSAQDYRAAIRTNRTARLTALAIVELADMYLSEEWDLGAEACALINRLDRDYRHAALPEDAPAWAGGEVATAIAALRQRMDQRQEDTDRSVGPLERFTFADTEARTIAEEGASLITFAGRPGSHRGSGAFVQTDRDAIAAVSPDDGARAWSARLSLLGHELDVLQDAERDDQTAPFPRMFVDGQIGIINGTQGTFAVGTLTGRRLWGVPYESPETAGAFDLRNRLVAVEGSRVVYAPRRGVLAAATIRDGADLIWERVLTGDKIDTILLEDGYCITLDNQRQVATTYDARNGRLRSRVAFSQPRPETAPIPAAYVRGHIVVPDGIDAVACFGVATGSSNWRAQLGEPVRWIFKPGEDLVGIACDSGRIVLIDVLGGDTVFDQQIPEADGGLAEGVIRDGAIVLLAVRESSQGDEPVLVSVDLETKRIRWRREGFGITGANRFAMWRLLRTARDVAPLPARVEVESENSFTRVMGEITVEVIDKATGRTVGAVVSTGHSASQRERLTGAFAITGSHMLLGTHNGVLSLKIAFGAGGDGPVEQLSDGRQR